MPLLRAFGRLARSLSLPDIGRARSGWKRGIVPLLRAFGRLARSLSLPDIGPPPLASPRGIVPAFRAFAVSGNAELPKPNRGHIDSPLHG